MIHLDYRDSRPIYEQVKDGLRRLMVTGVLAPGDKLPSVRAMASQLSINPNTIQRAYAELEAEGYVVSVTGKGCFVAEPDLALFREQSLHLLEDHLAAAAELARTCGLSEPELAELLRRKWEESL